MVGRAKATHPCRVCDEPGASEPGGRCAREANQATAHRRLRLSAAKTDHPAIAARIAQLTAAYAADSGRHVCWAGVLPWPGPDRADD